MAARGGSSRRKAGARKGAGRSAAAKRSSARSAAAKRARGSAAKRSSRPAARKRPAKRASGSGSSGSARRRQSPVARVKRVTREVVQQAQVAVTAGVETLRDLGENLVERVRSD
jgi:hypothetical protein